MKRNLLYIIILLFLPLFTVSCCTKDETLPELTSEELTSNQVMALMLTQSGLSDDSLVLMLDNTYTDYRNDLLTNISVAGAEVKGTYKDCLFDCEDIAYYVKGRVSKLIANECNGGAATIGIMFCELQSLEGEEVGYHALNLFIYDNIVFVFDGQSGKTYTLKSYMEIASIILILI